MPLNRRVSYPGFLDRFYQTRQLDYVRASYIFCSKGVEAGLEIGSRYLFENNEIRRASLLLLSQGEIGLIEPGTAIESQLNAAQWGVNYTRIKRFGDTLAPQPLPASFVIPPGFAEADLLIPLSVGSDGVVLSGKSARVSLTQNNTTTEIIRLWASDTDRRSESLIVSLVFPNDDGYILSIEVNPAGVTDGYQLDPTQTNTIMVNGTTINYAGNAAITPFNYADEAEPLAEQEAYVSLKTEVETSQLEGYSSAIVYTAVCCPGDPERILVREGISDRNWQATGVATLDGFQREDLAGQGILNADSQEFGTIDADGASSVTVRAGERWASFTTELLRYLPDIAVFLWLELDKHPSTLDWDELIESREFCVAQGFTCDIQTRGEYFSSLMNLLAPCSLLETSQGDGRWGLTYRRTNVVFVASPANARNFITGWEDLTQLARSVVCPYKNNDKIDSSGTVEPAHTLNGRSIFDDAQAFAATNYYLNIRQFRRYVEFDVSLSGMILEPGDAIVAFSDSFGLPPGNSGLTLSIDAPTGTAQSFVPRNQPVLLTGRVRNANFADSFIDNKVDFTQFGVSAGDLLIVGEEAIAIASVSATEVRLSTNRTTSNEVDEYSIIDLTLPDTPSFYLQKRDSGRVFTTTDITVAADGTNAKYTVDNLGVVIERGDSFVLLDDPPDIWSIFRVEPLDNRQEFRVRAVI